MSRCRAVPTYAAAERPMGELNTTPLIDVMLVLLVMFIVTIPISSHNVPVDLPQGPPPVRSEPVIHRVMLDAAGTIRLDGQALTLEGLRPRLDAIRANAEAVLLMQAEGEAPYDRFDQVMATVKRAGIGKLGMVGNEAFRTAID